MTNHRVEPADLLPMVLMLRAGCARTRAGEDPAASPAMPPATVRRNLRRPDLPYFRRRMLARDKPPLSQRCSIMGCFGRLAHLLSK
jgi:hypothetical protein